MRRRRDRFRRVRNEVILWLVAIVLSVWAIWLWLSILDPTNQIMRTALQEIEPYLKRAVAPWRDLAPPRQ